MDYVKELKNYLENIKPEDKIALMYHGFCGDGVCSGVITNNSVERILKRKIDLIIHKDNIELLEGDLDILNKNKITYLIIVDLDLIKSLDNLKKSSETMSILIMDHHNFRQDINSKNLLFIHSALYNDKVPSNWYPASKLTYDLFSELINIEDLDWISCAGLIYDTAYPQWKDFVQSVMKKYDIEIKDDIWSTEMGSLSFAIGVIKKFDELIDYSFDLISNAESYNDILHNEKVKEYRKKYNEDFQHWVNNRNKAEFHGDLIIYEIKPKYRTASTLSTVLSFDYFPGKTLVLIEEDEDFILNGNKMLKISARDQVPNVKVNELLEKTFLGFADANGGGHKQAAGARIRKEDLSKFKEKLIKVYNELRNKKL